MKQSFRIFTIFLLFFLMFLSNGNGQNHSCIVSKIRLRCNNLGKTNMICAPRHNETTSQDTRPSRGRRRVNFTAKDTEADCQGHSSDKRAPNTEQISPEQPSSPFTRKQRRILEGRKILEKLSDQSVPITRNAKKQETLHLNVKRKDEVRDKDDQISSKECGRRLPKVENPDSIYGVDKEPKPRSKKKKTFKFSSVSPADIETSDKCLSAASSPSKTRSVPVIRKTVMSNDQFRHHVETLVHQQCMLVAKISELQEDLQSIIVKMEEATGESLVERLAQSPEEDVKCAENKQDDASACRNSLDAVSSESNTLGVDVSPLTPDFSDQSNFEESRCQSSNNFCYVLHNKCWNANIIREEGEATEGRTQLDKLLLSREVSLTNEPWSMSCVSTKQSTSGSVYCQLQYIFLLVLVVVQFIIQFVCIRT